MPDYGKWSRDERSHRVILVEVDAYRPGIGEITHRWSTSGFISRATDDPPHKPYPALIQGVPKWTLDMDTPIGIGDIELSNADGSLDDLIYDSLGWREVRLYLGDPSWAKSDFYRFNFKSAKTGLQFSSTNGLVLPLAGVLELLDAPIQKVNYEGEDGDQKLLPTCIGSVFNAEPVFLKKDTSGAHYQIHDGAVTSIVLRSGGLGIDPGAVTLDLENGKFQIDPVPTGQVTCDIVSGNTRIIKVVEALLQRAGVPYDQVNLDTWDVLCPQTAGFYHSDSVTYFSVLEELLSSVGLRIHAWPDGVVRLWRVARPSGDPVMLLVPSMIEVNSLKPLGIIQPFEAIRLGYRRNHTVQSNLYEALEPDLADLYKKEWTVTVAETPGLSLIYPASEVLPDAITETALLTKADADLEAARRLDMYKAPIFEWEVKCFTDPNVSPGQVVLLQYPRFGFDSGVLALVVGLEWTPDKRTTIFKLWIWQET